jgi:EamA domain-containing membrane protein RarD
MSALPSGALPATVLAGYFSSYGLQQLANKLKNAAALTAHTGWLVFPALAALAFRSRWPGGRCVRCARVLH